MIVDSAEKEPDWRKAVLFEIVAAPKVKLYQPQSFFFGKKNLTLQELPQVAPPRPKLRYIRDPDSGNIVVRITIECDTPGAHFRYTTDGAEPTRTSTVYQPGTEILWDKPGHTVFKIITMKERMDHNTACVVAEIPKERDADLPLVLPPTVEHPHGMPKTLISAMNKLREELLTMQKRESIHRDKLYSNLLNNINQEMKMPVISPKSSVSGTGEDILKGAEKVTIVEPVVEEPPYKGESFKDESREKKERWTMFALTKRVRCMHETLVQMPSAVLNAIEIDVEEEVYRLIRQYTQVDTTTAQPKGEGGADAEGFVKVENLVEDEEKPKKRRVFGVHWTYDNRPTTEAEECILDARPKMRVTFYAKPRVVDEILRVLRGDFGLGDIHGLLALQEVNMVRWPRKYTEKEGLTGNLGEKRQKNVKEEWEDRLTVEQLVRDIRTGTDLTVEYLFMVSVAAVVAGLGLASNSVVVVVASMLISPIMGPILGQVMGAIIMDKSLCLHGLLTELVGLALCLVWGLIISFCFWNWGDFYDWPTNEMVSRGETSGLAMGVGVAIPSGAGVALSLLQKNANSLVGVAISASLLPPAVNAGMMYGYSIVGPRNLTRNGEPIPDSELVDKGTISLCLTLVNIVCIFISAYLIFKLRGVTVRKESTTGLLLSKLNEMTAPRKSNEVWTRQAPSIDQWKRKAMDPNGLRVRVLPNKEKVRQLVESPWCFASPEGKLTWSDERESYCGQAGIVWQDNILTKQACVVFADGKHLWWPLEALEDVQGKPPAPSSQPPVGLAKRGSERPVKTGSIKKINSHQHFDPEEEEAVDRDVPLSTHTPVVAGEWDGSQVDMHAESLKDLKDALQTDGEIIPLGDLTSPKVPARSSSAIQFRARNNEPFESD